MNSINRGSLALDTDRQAAPGSVLAVDPLADPLWRRLIETHDSSVFHSPLWMRVLKATYDLDIQALVLLDGSGNPRAGIPFARVEDWAGPRVVSLPFSDYCDPIVRDREEWNSLIEVLLADDPLTATRCLHNAIPLTDNRFDVVNRAKWHGLDLTPSVDSLWAGLDGAARRAVRKAERDGVEVRIIDRIEELRDFYNLHLGIRKYKYHMIAQPYSFFEKLWQEAMAAGKGYVMAARMDGNLIGGVFFLEWKNTLFYKFNASHPDYLSHRPNDLIIWRGIRHARERGLNRMDFGLSDWDQDDLIRYKRKYAGEEKTISYLRHIPEAGVDPRGSEFRALLHRLTDLLTDPTVPDDVTGRAGDLLYSYFA